MKIINVILSGGIGSRLWPLSRKGKPKQYLPIFEGETLFQKTVSRNLQICDQILVVGNKENHKLSINDLVSLGQKDYLEIIEACPRNTAAAIAFAAFSVQSDDILFVTPSDHLIISGLEYFEKIKRGIFLAKQGSIITFGLKPRRAETGFGYIEAEGEEVKSFREKPDQKTAKNFIEKGNFFWNSGIFCFQAGVFLNELEKCEPEVYIKSKLAFENSENGIIDEFLSLQIPSISVDYAVMEKTAKIKVVPSEFHWSDMGSFESIYEYLSSQGYQKDPNGNMVIGTDVYTEFTGLKNTILVQTPDAILVLNKENAQQIKTVYERLEKEKPELT